MLGKLGKTIMELSSEGRGHVTAILTIYLVCFGAYSLVSVPFWDDWVIVQNGQNSLWEMFQQLGRREQFPLIAPFAIYMQPIVWAVANFICWGMVPICVYAILRRLGVEPTNSLWAGLLTAAAPLNEARFALAVLPYSFSAAFFSVGLYLVVRSVGSRTLLPRIAAAVLLFWSFSTNSFLTISWLAPLFVFIVTIKTEPERGLAGGARVVLSRGELVLLPAIYWSIKTVFQPAYGLYQGYNNFEMDPFRAILLSALRLPLQVPDPGAFFPTVNFLLEALACAIVVVAAMLILASAFKVSLTPTKLNKKKSLLVIAVLLPAAVLAIFPYAIVGHEPSFMGLWETRHQTVLAPLAGALVFFLLSAIVPLRWLRLVSVTVLLLFVACDISASRQLLLDVQTTRALLHSNQVASIPSGTMLSIVETERSYRMLSKSFQFYDASSTFNAHREAKDLLVISQNEALDPSSGAIAAIGSDAFPQTAERVCRAFVSLPQYGFGDFVSNGWFADVTLIRTSPPPSFPYAIASAIWAFVNPEAANANAIADLTIKVSPRTYSPLSCTDKCCSTRASNIDWESVVKGF